MKKIIIIWAAASIVAASASSCALFADRIAGKVADVIDDYCKESQAQRVIYADQVNAELAAEGHRISVTCAGDTGPSP